MNRAHSPLRYVGRQAWDVARAPLLLFVIVSAGLAFVVWKIFGSRDLPQIEQLLASLIAGTLLIATLIASGGVAGTDIKQGYYRAWFSKPIAPWWFYLERWLLGGLAVLSIPVWLGLSLQVAFGKGNGMTWPLFGAVALGYLLIGGAVLLFSTITARDWLVVFLVYFFEMRLHDASEVLTRMGTDLPWAVHWALVVLPPFHLVAANQPLPTGADLVHVLGYGGGMVLAALLMLRYRPLGSGGRA